MSQLRGVFALVALLWPTAAFSQPAAPAGTLRVTVTDPSGAVVPGATVTVTGAEDATKGAAIPPVQTTDVGVATISNLKPGRYIIKAEFPGFEARTLPEVRVRPGDNKQVAIGFNLTF